MQTYALTHTHTQRLTDYVGATDLRCEPGVLAEFAQLVLRAQKVLWEATGDRNEMGLCLAVGLDERCVTVAKRSRQTARCPADRLHHVTDEWMMDGWWGW